MFVVDTNVLVYAANSASPFHGRCAGLLARWRPQREVWFVTWSICYEFLRVVTHPRVFEQPWNQEAAWSFVDALLASPGLTVLRETDRHSDVARAVVAETPALDGNLFHDAHTAILMREHGIRRIVTRDTDFHRFGFVEPIDPLIEGESGWRD
jgi:toxin-antitoxin system PIN domain toxin